MSAREFLVRPTRWHLLCKGGRPVCGAILGLCLIMFSPQPIAHAGAGQTATAQTAGGLAPDAVPPVPDSIPAVAAVESALFTGDLHDLEITNGALTLDVIRRGPSASLLDWSDVTISMHDLKWGDQPLRAGTSPDLHMVIFTDRDHDRLTGKWSGHGHQISQKSVFDLVFPPALNTRVILHLPVELAMESTQGVLTSSPQVQSGKREWIVELGSINSTTLAVGPAQDFQRTVTPRYEIETEYRARRDGNFVKSDLTIDGHYPEKTPLQLTVPAAVEIQSVAVFSGSSPIAAAISFQRHAEQPDLVSIPLENLNLESRLTVRLRGFQPVVWGKLHRFPAISLLSAIETRRSTVVRIEPPLQLQSVDAQGMLQTSLTSEETAGEVWKFETREPESSLSALIDLPKSEITAEMNCLADARRQVGWAAVVLSMHVENGSRFNATLQLPEDWKLVSVTAGDAESRLSSWIVNQRQLHVTWQNPMTSTSHRQLWLFARTPPWSMQTPTRLQIPVLREASSMTVQYQVLPPAGMELQVIEGEGWRHSENTKIFPPLLRLREVAERLADAPSVSCSALRTTNENRGGRTLIHLVPKALSTDSLTTQSGSHPVAPPVFPDTALKQPSEGDETPSPSPTMEMQLLTMAGPLIGKGCVHHAGLQFNIPVPASDLHLQLPASCRVSAVEVDGQSVTVFRNGAEIPLPGELSMVSRINLTYMTNSGSGWPYRTNHVPIPQTSIPVTGVNWMLDLPGDQQLSQIHFPGVMSVTSPDTDAARQYFGPLTRPKSDRMFNPLSSQDWSDLLEARRDPQIGEPVRRMVQYVAPAVGSEVQFVTWNSSTVRHSGWVALLGCLMIGAAARLFRIHWLRGISTVWLILLLTAAMLAPIAWSIIIGGMLAGSLISILIPRRWMQKRDFLRSSRHDEATAAKLAAATAILLGWFFAWSPHGIIAADSDSTQNQNTPRQSSANLDGPASAQSTPPPAPVPVVIEDSVYPLYLIESARYELTRLAPTPKLRATFVLQVRPHTEEIFVRLPLQEIIFSSAAECLVDGETQPIIPSLAGDAMVVALQNKTSARPDTSPERWLRSEIQLEFTIRPGNSSSDMSFQLAPFRAIVPAVLDSTLKVPASLASIPLSRWGEIVSQGAESSLVSLGGIGRIGSDFESSGPMDAMGASPVTMLDVTPLRFKGQTRILPGPNGWPARLPLTFPSGCVISSLSGSSLLSYIDAPAEDAGPMLTLRLRQGIPASPIVINFELPGGPQNPAELTIPPFPLWKGQNMMHALGMTGPQTAALSLIKTPGVIPLAPEEWPTDGDASRGRPAIAVAVNSPQRIQLGWNRLNPIRTATLAEQLLVQREGIEWNARVQMNVSQIPTFLHQFRVDPALRIESVTLGENRNEGNIRYSRTGNILSVFIPGGQLGDRTFRMTGELPLTVDAWVTIPSFEVLGATVSDMQMTVLDQTGWNLELESVPGVPLTTTPPPRNRDQTADSNLARTVGTFRRDAGATPQRLRVVVPAEATRVDSVLLLGTPTAEHWDVVTTFHLTAVESTLRKAVFQIPPEMTGIRIRPAQFQFTTATNDTGTTVTVRIPDRYANSATISIAARIGTGLQEQLLATSTAGQHPPVFPQIEVLSAQKASQFVLIDAKSQMIPAPTGSLRIDAAAFPTWASSEWVRAVQDRSLICYQQIRKDLIITTKTAADLTGQPVIRLEETILWPTQKQVVRGLTRIWVASKGHSRLRIAHDPELKIDSIMTSESGQVNWSQTEAGTDLELPRRKSVSSIVIQWGREVSQAPVSLLKYENQIPEQRLVGITCPDEWHLAADGQTPVDPLKIWLTRWDLLMQCVRDLSGPVPVDSLLLSNIRLCEREATQLLPLHPGEQESADREEYDRVLSVWDALKNDLIISADKPSPEIDPLADVFTELLNQRNSGLQVTWLNPEGNDWSGKFVEPETVLPNQRMLWGGLLALFGIVCVFRFSRRLSYFRELIALHPTWSLICLGLVWWICLSPSMVGMLIILFAWISSAVHWFMSRFFRSRRKASAAA